MKVCTDCDGEKFVGRGYRNPLTLSAKHFGKLTAECETCDGTGIVRRTAEDAIKETEDWKQPLTRLVGSAELFEAMAVVGAECETGGGTAQDIGQGEDPLQVFWPDALKLEAYFDEDKERLYAGMGVPKEFLEGPTNFSSAEMALRGYPPRDLSAQYQQQPPPLEPRDICVCLHHADQHKWLNDPAPLRSRHLRCTVCDCGHFKERE